MSGYLGDFTTSNTIYILFNTFSSNDPSASVTLTGLALGDILIYKNGSITQRSSTSGFTLLDTDGIDFDGTTGIHGVSIDLSDNTDAGFFAAGSEYTVVIASVTVDAATINFVAGSFSIERAGGALALIKAGNLSANVVQLGGVTQSLTDLKDFADVGYDPATNKVQGVVLTDTVTTYTNNTPQAGDNFSRLGVPAGASIAADLIVIDNFVDGIETAVVTNAAGVDIAADIIAIKAETASILTDTAEIGIAGAGLTNIGTIDTVTTLTNLPSITVGWLTAAGISASALNGKGDWNINKTGYSISGTKTTLDALNDIAATAIVSAGAITTLGGAIVNVNTVDVLTTYTGNTPQTADHAANIASILTDTGTTLDVKLNDIQGATFNNTTDSLEAIRNQGDSAWGTATGFSTHTATNVWAVATRLLTAGTNIALAKGVGVTGFNDLSAAQINTEVDNALDTAIPGVPTAGSINDVLDRQEELMVSGSAQTGTLSTTEMTTDLTVSIANQYNGRIITFRKDTVTVALRGQQTDITSTVITGSKLGFTALTTAPANGDIFDIT